MDYTRGAFIESFAKPILERAKTLVDRFIHDS
jgi:hypothetical protein